MKNKKNFWGIGGGNQTNFNGGNNGSVGNGGGLTSNNVNNNNNSTTSVNTGIKEGNTFGVHLNELFKRPSSVNNLPNIVYHITTNLREYGGLSLEGIFRVNGSNPDIQNLRKQYDEGKVVSREMLHEKCPDLYTQTSLLKLFIRELPDPLFTFRLYESFVNSHVNSDKLTRVSTLKSLLNQLPLAHYSLLMHLAELLRDVSRNSSVNKMVSSNLAIVFGPTVMRPQREDMVRMIEDARHVNGVFLLIIEEYDYLFNGAEVPTILQNITTSGGAVISHKIVSQLQSNQPSTKRNALKLTSSDEFGNGNSNSPNGILFSHKHNYRPELVSPSSPLTIYDDGESLFTIGSPPPPPPPSPLSPTSLAIPEQTNTVHKQQYHHHHHQNNNNNTKFSILMPQQQQTSNLSPSIIGSNTLSPNSQQSTPTRLSHHSPTLSPLPPTSPRSSVIFDYENPELIRLLINRTCSQLFDKEFQVTDQFEMVRNDEQLMMPVVIEGLPSIGGDHPMMSPRFGHHRSSSDPLSSTSSPQLKSLLKQQHVNSLTAIQQTENQMINDKLLSSIAKDKEKELNNNGHPSHQTSTSASTSTSNSPIQSRLQQASTSSPNTSPKLVRSANHTESNPLEMAWSHLIQLRRESGRPSDLKLMSLTELKEEKSSIKKELREYDFRFKRTHGQLPKKSDKEVMRPLYQRYREVKTLLDIAITSQNVTSPNNNNINNNDNNNNPNPNLVTPIRNVNNQPNSQTATTTMRHDYPSMTKNEVLELYQSLRSEKKNLQLSLHKYQTEFLKEHGRKVQFVNDRLPVHHQYERYKVLKLDIADIEEYIKIHKLIKDEEEENIIINN